MTLHEALAAKGYTSRKENDVQRRSVYDANGRFVGSFTAKEAWACLSAL